MRDPKRIETILSTLEEYWKKYPDLRLGQILVNMNKVSSKRDLYYLEDDELFSIIQDELENSVS